MPIPLALALAPAVLGGVMQYQGQKGAQATTRAGARSSAKIEKMQRDASQKEFERQMARQKPYLEAGTASLPMLVEALSNRDPGGTPSADLPGSQIQGNLIAEFLGDEAPAFIRDRAMTNLGAVEAEKQKGRLLDLVSAGAGGAMSAAGAGVNLGTSLGRSLSSSAAGAGSALQNQAIMRQNAINQGIQQAAGLPALVAAYRGPKSNAYSPDLSRSPITETGAWGR